eukprot:1160227-Pelagomonas_calceolata.AAC.3
MEEGAHGQVGRLSILNVSDEASPEAFKGAHEQAWAVASPAPNTRMLGQQAQASLPLCRKRLSIKDSLRASSGVSSAERMSTYGGRDTTVPTLSEPLLNMLKHITMLKHVGQNCEVACVCRQKQLCLSRPTLQGSKKKVDTREHTSQEKKESYCAGKTVLEQAHSTGIEKRSGYSRTLACHRKRRKAIVQGRADWAGTRRNKGAPERVDRFGAFKLWGHHQRRAPQ